MWTLEENGTGELICKAETESQTQRRNLWTPKGRGRGMDWGI